MSAFDNEVARARADAVKALLVTPLIDHEHAPDAFRLVVQQRDWLEPWFEATCGWTLRIDLRDGVARLAKRSSHPDPTRPAIRPRRSRSARRPFDRRRYELLCLVAADLVRRPATTIGLLAAELISVTTADPDLTPFTPSQRASERRAFVDALNLLASWGAVSVAAGQLGDYVDDPDSNAIIDVDQSRLHLLLSSARAPSAIAGELEATPGDATTDERVGALTFEPRYAAAEEAGTEDAAYADVASAGSDDGVSTVATDELRNRWRRHRLARRLLDDPVVHLDELTEGERAYLTSQAGRVWLRARIAEAGFHLEERVEGWAAIDPDAVATDRVFPGPGDNVKQAALLLLDRLVTADGDDRRLVSRTRADLERRMLELLVRYRGWAKQAREDDGHVRLVADAITLLAEVGLVTVEGDRIIPRPMLARYTSVAPDTRALTLFGAEGTDAPGPALETTP